MISLNGKVVNSNPDKKVWSLEPSGYFTVRSLVTHLSFGSPLDVSLKESTSSCGLCFQGNLNCISSLQKKLPSHCLSPMCHLCCMNQDLQHLVFEYPYTVNCWCRLLQIFNFRWVFYGSFSGNVLQILWCNVVNALLVKYGLKTHFLQYGFTMIGQNTLKLIDPWSKKKSSMKWFISTMCPQSNR